MGYNCTNTLNKLLHELFQTRTSSAKCVSTKGLSRVYTTHTQHVSMPSNLDILVGLRFSEIILTCSGWVDDQEGQPATLAALLALSLRRWVSLLQVGMSTE